MLHERPAFIYGPYRSGLLILDCYSVTNLREKTSKVGLWVSPAKSAKIWVGGNKMKPPDAVMLRNSVTRILDAGCLLVRTKMNVILKDTGNDGRVLVIIATSTDI